MAVTKYMLAEDILRILKGGNIAAGDKVRKEDIYASISQVANALLSATYGQGLKTGEAIPPGAMMAWYPGITLTAADGYCTATLPAAPIYLPRDAGLAIYDPSILNYEYIPMEQGVPGYVADNNLLNSIIGPYYTRRGLTVRFSEDLTLLGKTEVDVSLCIMDISNYSEFEGLPLFPDHEFAIKQQVLALHGAQMQPADKLVDFNKEQKQPIQTQNQV